MSSGKNFKNKGRLECRLFILAIISFFCPFTMVYFSIFSLLFLFSILGGNGLRYGVVRECEAISYQGYTDFFYELQTFANHLNPHALYHVLCTVHFFFFQIHK